MPLLRWMPARVYVLLPFVLIVALVFFVYSPVLSAGFLSWDDDSNILRNPYYLRGRWYELWWKPYYGMYVPVISTVWYGLWKAGGGSAEPFRIFNLSLHLLNTFLAAVLVRSFLRVATGRVLGIGLWAAVAVFALHPLQVGAVAWISGGRDLLSVFFSLLAVIVFFRRHGVAAYSWKIGKHVASCFLFALALLCKPQAAAVPLALAGYLVLVEERRWPYVVKRLFGWLVLSAGAAWVTAAAQEGVMDWVTPVWQRPVVMADAFGFLLGKVLVPFDLYTDYGRTPAFLFSEPAVIIWPLALFGAAAGFLFVKSRVSPKWCVGWLWFLLLLPVSGIVNFGFQHMSTVADHYAYPAMVVVAMMIGLIATFVARSGVGRFIRGACKDAGDSSRRARDGGCDSTRRVHDGRDDSIRRAHKGFHFTARLACKGVGFARLSRNGFGYMVVAVLVGCMVVLSWRQAGTWSAERPFFAHMLQGNPNSYTAHVALGTLDCIRGNEQERGLSHLLKARELRPDDPIATADYANCLFRMKKFGEALDLEKSVYTAEFVSRLQGNAAATAALFSAFGASHFEQGHALIAFRYFCQAVWHEPFNVDYRNNVRVVQSVLGQRSARPECEPKAGVTEFASSVAEK